MSNPQYDLASSDLGKLAKFVNESATGNSKDRGKKEGSLATALEPYNGSSQLVHVVRDYPWTLSQKTGDELEEIPYIRLKEYKCVDSSIKKQLAFYSQLTLDTAANSLPGTKSRLPGRDVSVDVYADIWPKDNETGFIYMFPYFQKSGFELQTEPWSNIGSVGDSLKGIAQGIAKMANTDKARDRADKFSDALDLAGGVTNAAMNFSYPSVGITDRPKMFMAHSDRTITINFPLYNTINSGDWAKNRNLIYLLMSQNLFNKRDLTTGVPPVFYDVHIPGQYYSYASAITNFKVDYLGNQRLLYGGYIIPDAYDVSITLTELVKPSKNQFEAVQSGAAENYVNVSVSKALKGLRAVSDLTDALITAIGDGIEGTGTRSPGNKDSGVNTGNGYNPTVGMGGFNSPVEKE